MLSSGWRAAMPLCKLWPMMGLLGWDGVESLLVLGSVPSRGVSGGWWERRVGPGDRRRSRIRRDVAGSVPRVRQDMGRTPANGGYAPLAEARTWEYIAMGRDRLYDGFHAERSTLCRGEGDRISPS